MPNKKYHTPDIKHVILKRDMFYYKAFLNVFLCIAQEHQKKM
jgi:hypothetical protein